MTNPRIGAVLIVWLALPAAAPAAAGTGTTPDPLYQAECGSCHVAYPARMLPAESWRRLIAGLSAHFGADASLDADTAAAIGQYLTSHARPSRRTASAVPLRITETKWFRHEHDEVSRAWWDSPAVRGPADCGACHMQAERGRFGEGGIRRPQ
jgi:hypothetical protein